MTSTCKGHGISGCTPLCNSNYCNTRTALFAARRKAQRGQREIGGKRRHQRESYAFLNGASGASCRESVPYYCSYCTKYCIRYRTPSFMVT